MLKASGNVTNTFDWNDLVTLLSQLDYQKIERAGSRVVFVHQDSNIPSIHLHRPHPENHIKGGALKDIKQHLKNRGVL